MALDVRPEHRQHGCRFGPPTTCRAGLNARSWNRERRGRLRGFVQKRFMPTGRSGASHGKAQGRPLPERKPQGRPCPPKPPTVSWGHALLFQAPTTCFHPLAGRPPQVGSAPSRCTSFFPSSCADVGAGEMPHRRGPRAGVCPGGSHSRGGTEGGPASVGSVFRGPCLCLAGFTSCPRHRAEDASLGQRPGDHATSSGQPQGLGFQFSFIE